MKPKPREFDSIQELARFWDSHDLTDFEDQLQKVKKPVFVRRPVINLNLKAREAKSLERIARLKGVSREELARTWVLQKLARQPHVIRMKPSA